MLNGLMNPNVAENIVNRWAKEILTGFFRNQIRGSDR
jgi:hypothetical protein